MVVEEVDVPTPGLRQVVVKVATASLYSTDLSIINGGLSPGLFLLILGHEAVGFIGSWALVARLMD